MGSIVNTQQAEAWNGYEGERWADHFAQVSLASVEVPMKYGDDAMTAVEMFLSSGPVRFKLGEADRATETRTLQAVTAVWRPFRSLAVSDCAAHSGSSAPCDPDKGRDATGRGSDNRSAAVPVANPTQHLAQWPPPVSTGEGRAQVAYRRYGI